MFRLLAITILGLGACASVPPASSSPSHAEQSAAASEVRAVYQASGDVWKDGVSRALFYVDKTVQAYEQRGVRREHLALVVVYHGDAGYHLLNDSAFERFAGVRSVTAAVNPNAHRVRELSDRGIRIEMCSSTMRHHGWTERDLLPGVHVVPNAYPRVIDLQMDGYAHILFD